MSALSRHPLLWRLAVWVCLPTAIACWFGYAQLRQSLPQAGDRSVAKGLAADVHITRDAHGVPHIRASSDMDAYFAMGYLHAQDRLWQLELARRVAQGRLAEVLGQQALSSDIWMRTLDIHGAAERAWPALAPDAKRSLQAYADGINARLDEGTTLPPEFLLLGVTPERWTPIDSLAWFKVFSLNQSNGMRAEADRYLARKFLPERQWALLERSYPADAPTTLTLDQPMQALSDLSRRLERTLGLGGPYVGSNAWVLAGRLTRDGAPLLANDPHMSLQMPSAWYVADLSAPGFAVSGMSVVGLPIIVFGRNRHVAWGGTNMMADTQDLYALETHPERPNVYRVDGQWHAMTVRQEEIAVRADFPASLRAPRAPVRVQVRSTRFGPVVSDATGLFDQPISLRWSGLDDGDTSYQGIFRLAYARNWADFNAALGQVVTPAINVVYADDAGNIGYVAAGRIPLRGTGDGSMPTPAAGSASGWRGYVPFGEMPRALNPASGVIVSANNKVVDDRYPHFISRDWAPPARAERITAMIADALRRNGKIDTEQTRLMQADTVDLEALALRDYLVAHVSPELASSAAVRDLARWDGRMDTDQPSATVFNFWLRHLRKRLLLDRIDDEQGAADQLQALRGYVGGVTPVQIRQLLQSGDPAWCGSASKDATGCTGPLQAALDDALRELRKYGSDRSDWAWGTLHRARFNHVPFGDVNLLDRVFSRRLPSPGSENSVNVAGSLYRPMKGYEQNFGAVFRQVMVMGQGGGEHAYMNSTGQSGNPMSPHFDDMLEPFAHAQLYALKQPDAAAGAMRQTLHAAGGASGARP